LYTFHETRKNCWGLIQNIKFAELCILDNLLLPWGGYIWLFFFLHQHIRLRILSFSARYLVTYLMYKVNSSSSSSKTCSSIRVRRHRKGHFAISKAYYHWHQHLLKAITLLKRLFEIVKLLFTRVKDSRELLLLFVVWNCAYFSRVFGSVISSRFKIVTAFISWLKQILFLGSFTVIKTCYPHKHRFVT
jgi:hypothetical protein